MDNVLKLFSNSLIGILTNDSKYSLSTLYFIREKRFDINTILDTQLPNNF
ncbi:6627_t:CDS:2 [Dentiscutata erythropus]|uniref:6627_t:CDS:1 n=1 Tax=Dentiscutata erythropus TaxID=1348616 RepID=A0A9N8ZQ15_9GLOM|nr:6627_t:CDS:2 [Dentiscutata erythropus]